MWSLRTSVVDYPVRVGQPVCQVSGFLGGERDYSIQMVFFISILLYSMLLVARFTPAQLPWWALFLVSLSKIMHSIFVLRLFNECFATTLFHGALISFLYQKWHLNLVIFSGAVSLKMNVLLYAPTLLLLLIKALDPFGVAGAALVQIFLGLPFLLSHQVEYLSRAFNLGRVYIHFWYFR